jgi:phage-related protein
MSEFNFNPDFVIDEEIEFKTLVSEYENGAEQRRRKWENPRRKWFLRFNTRIKSELVNIMNFFVNKSGAYQGFTWTNPNDGIEYFVRFVEDSLKFTLKAYEIYDLELRLIEVK